MSQRSKSEVIEEGHRREIFLLGFGVKIRI